MTDLVQKIADAVWARITLPDVYEPADIQDAIRQALADAGGEAVAWAHVATMGGKDIIQYPVYLWEDDAVDDLARYAEGAKVRVEPLSYTHPAPSADRVAELERERQISAELSRKVVALEQQLTESREREIDWMSTAAAMLNTTYEQRKAMFESTCANYSAALAAEQEKNDE